MEKGNDFEEKIQNAIFKADQISSIALCAMTASGSIAPADRDKHISGALYGIISLCEMITAELDSISD